MPEQSTSALATRPQPSRTAIALDDARTGRRQHDDERDPFAAATVAAWARFAEGCDDSGVPARAAPPSANSTHTTRRSPVGRLEERTSIVAASSTTLRNESARDRHRRSTVAAVIAPCGRRSGKASEPRRTPACSSARAGQHGAHHVEQRLGRAGRAGPPV